MHEFNEPFVTAWQLVAGVLLTGCAVAFAAYRPRQAQTTG